MLETMEVTEELIFSATDDEIGAEVVDFDDGLSSLQSLEGGCTMEVFEMTIDFGDSATAWDVSLDDSEGGAGTMVEIDSGL